MGDLSFLVQGDLPNLLFCHSYSAGSEDDRAYVWAIPDLELLRERRKEINKSNDSTIEGGPALLSATIDTPSSILYGHRAIVNVTLFHPRLPLLFTSGASLLFLEFFSLRPYFVLLTFLVFFSVLRGRESSFCSFPNGIGTLFHFLSEYSETRRANRRRRRRRLLGRRTGR